MENNAYIKEKYFAAANGYNGFKSYFSEVFTPTDYERIYVLKGGPGTGKSTFMKKLGRALTESGYKVEAIFCSSDPKSLDGITGRSDNKSIAVLDGTAPHERDAIIPGAFDEIINLGEAWDTRYLKSQREGIYSLNLEKKQAYKTAYFYLSVAGKSRKLSASLYGDAYNDKIKNVATKLAADLFEDAKTGKIKTRLISAYGRSGAVRFDTVESISSKLYSLPDSLASRIILRELYVLALSKNLEIMHSPTALDESLTDAIFISSTGIGIVIGSSGEAIDLAGVDNISELNLERVRVADNIHTTALVEAQRWFSIASDLHARLESIYSSAVDFSIIDDTYDKKCAEILEILR